MRYAIVLLAALVCGSAFGADRGWRVRPAPVTYSTAPACSSCQQGSCSLKAEQPTVIQAATVAAPVATCSGGSCQAAPARRGLFGLRR